MKKIHALWLLAYPVYQVIGTVRHELSHAVAAIFQGATITKMQFLPSFLPGRGWLWGYVRWVGGHTNWVADSAPYFCDLLFFSLFFWICNRFRRMPAWLWVNCFIIGMVSPLLNMVYNYQKVFTSIHGDVNRMLTQLPHNLVHSVFIGAIVLLGAGTWATIRFLNDSWTMDGARTGGLTRAAPVTGPG